MRLRNTFCLALLLTAGAFAHADKELGLILQSDSWSALQQSRRELKEKTVQERACRIQIEHKLIPEACLRDKNYSKRKINEACVGASYADSSLSLIDSALRLKGWDGECRRQLLNWRERKIYQSEESGIGLSFEERLRDAGDFEAKTTDL